MADLINLNKARKAQEKAKEKARAGANRVLHGLTKAEKAKVKAEHDLQTRRLDETKRDLD